MIGYPKVDPISMAWAAVNPRHPLPVELARTYWSPTSVPNPGRVVGAEGRATSAKFSIKRPVSSRESVREVRTRQAGVQLPNGTPTPQFTGV